MSIAPKAEQDRNQEATVYLVSVHPLAVSSNKGSCSGIMLTTKGNLDEKCTDALIWELML